MCAAYGTAGGNLREIIENQINVPGGVSSDENFSDTDLDRFKRDTFPEQLSTNEQTAMPYHFTAGKSAGPYKRLGLSH